MKYLSMVIAVSICLCGCGTIGRMRPNYTNMPADSMRAVALEIEKAVLAGDREPKIADRDGIVVNTDEIKQAIRTRAIRSKLIQAFLETGHAAEMNNGMVSVLRTSAYKKFGSSRDRDRNALLIDSECADRWKIYEGIVKESHFRSKNLGAVQQIFYEAHVQLLPKGQKYQDASGKIVTK